MANIFSRPISSDFQQTYVSQHVPLPLEQFARAQQKLETTQQNEENQLAQASNAAWNIHGIADSDNEYVEGIRSKFDETANKLANSNLTLRENQEAAKSIVQDISRDKDLATIMSNAAKVKQYQEDKRKMIEAGTYQDYNDNFIPTFNNYSANGGYKSGKNIDTTIHKYSEERPKMEEYFNNMGENGADSLGKIGETYYKSGWEGVSKNQATSRAYQAFNSYLGTPEGQQGVRRYNYLKATNPGALKGIKSGSEYVFNQFLDAGLERVHGKSTSGLAAAMNADSKEKKEEQNLFGGVLSTEIPGTLTNGRKFEFDDKGQIIGSGKGFFQTMMETSAKHPINAFMKWKNDHDPNDQEKIDAANLITAARLSGSTPKEYAERFNTTTHMKVDHPLIGKALRDNTEALFNGSAGLYSNMNVMGITSGERNMNFIDALKKSGVDVPDPKKHPEEFKKMLKDNVSITGEANANEFSARPVIFTVGNNEFAVDMTYNGKSNPFGSGKVAETKLAEAQRLQKYDKLMKGQVVEGTHEGKKGLFFRNISKLDDNGEPIIDFKAE